MNRSVSQLAERTLEVVVAAELPDFDEASRAKIVRAMVNLLLQPEATLAALAHGDRVRAERAKGQTDNADPA